MVGKNKKWTQAVTHTILYTGRRDCRAIRRQQIKISLPPPNYLEKSKRVSNPNNSTLASYLQVDTRRII